MLNEKKILSVARNVQTVLKWTENICSEQKLNIVYKKKYISHFVDLNEHKNVSIRKNSV